MHVQGIEPDPVSRNKSISQFKLKVFDENKLNEFQPEHFDVISLWHVLEHVSNLDSRMNQLERILKPEGIIILALPNHNSYDAHYYQSYWAGYDVPRHLWHFTPETVKRLAENYNFKIEEILPMSFDSFYVSMLSEKYKNSLLSVIRGFFRGFISNTKAWFNKKNTFSSQIYILKKNL
jgi:ubiquinone/menaquinone biosynthesis C-methylase UbiE